MKRELQPIQGNPQESGTARKSKSRMRRAYDSRKIAKKFRALKLDVEWEIQQWYEIVTHPNSTPSLRAQALSKLQEYRNQVVDLQPQSGLSPPHPYRHLGYSTYDRNLDADFLEEVERAGG